jgi:hypothetical protein
MRRPLLLALILGCAVSALASGRLSPWRILDGALSFAFVPAIHVLALGVVYRRIRPPELSFARAADLFFSGNGVWLVWTIAIAAIGAAVPPRQMGPWLLPLLASLAVPIAWSLWIDFTYFRHALHRSPAAAAASLVAQRAIAWTGVTLYFGYNAAWPLEQALTL